MRLPDLGSRVANITNYGRARPECLVEAPAALRLERPLLALFLSTVFLNAALLFIIEPMMAKMILPFAGGSPAVWNTSLLFFQASLLLGYLYAHFASSWLGTSRHALIHLLLVLAGLLFLPAAISADWFTGSKVYPAIAVLAALTSSIGFPFFVLSAGAPLLQKWLAEAKHSTGRDPYFMYAASNLGSLVGLLAYPFFFERRLTLAQQAEFWLFGYLVLLLGIAACILRSFRFSERSKADIQASDPRALHDGLNASSVGAITITRRVRWLWLSFVPSSLLLGVTSYITTDIVSAPLFWVLPLTIYLLTYVLAFSGERWATHTFVVRRQAFLLLGSALTVFVQATTPVGIILPLHLLAFFATALLCHGQLAKDRPAPNRLTEFYLWISVGGVLGGLFNAIVAPLLFSSVIEYPLAMLAAAFLRPYVGGGSDARGSRWSDWLLPGALFVAILLLIAVAAITRISPPNAQLLIYATSGVICLSFAYRPIRFGLGLGAILLGSLIAPHPIGKTLYAARSFFGVYRAIDDPEGGRHVLFHGTTVHGAQNLKSSLQPIGYYHRSGPAGQVLRAAAQSQPNANVAIIGLGTGALACHGSAGQKFTFFEIDPLVEKIARDEKLFTYLRDCPPKTEVVIGDGRLSMMKASSNFYDVLVLDAFSSDVIPSHLLTLEAMELYLAKTASDGIVLIHISNRYLDLMPVLDRLAQKLNLVGFLRNDFNVTAEEQTEGKSVSRWIAMSRRREALATFLDQDWQPLDGRSGGDLWTDDFADVVKVMYWR